MPSTLQSAQINDATTSALLNPLDIIDRMIELRIQLQELESQIASLQPAFFAACLALNTEKIERTRAVISRRLTPGQWTYSIDILEQVSFLKQLKKQFLLYFHEFGTRFTANFGRSKPINSDRR